MFDFAFADLCLGLLHHMQKCRFARVIVQFGTQNKPTSTAKNVSIIQMEQYFGPIFSSHEISFLARKCSLIDQKTSDYFAILSALYLQIIRPSGT